MTSEHADFGPPIAVFIAGQLMEWAPPSEFFRSDNVATIAEELFPGRAWKHLRGGDEFAPDMAAAGSVLVVPDWDRRLQDEQQSEYIHAIAKAADAFWLVTPAQSLRLGPWPGPLRLLRRTHTPKLIVETELASNTIPAHLDIALLLLAEEETHNVTRFFRTPQGVEREEVWKDLARLLGAQGGSTTWGWVHRGQLATDSWRSIDHDPDLDRKQRELSSFGESRQVRNIFQVITTRPGPQIPSLGMIETSEPVLSGRDVVAGDLSTPARPRGITRAVTLRAGDLLLPRSERPGAPTMPLAVQDHHLPLNAGHSVVVLRPRLPLQPQEVEFYSAYLGSSRSRALLRGGPISRRMVDLTPIGRLPVPVPDGPLLDAISVLTLSRKMFREWAQDTDDVLIGMFDRDQPLVEARVELVEKGRVMRQRRAAGEMVTTLDYRIREFYPYPVAYRWRQVQTHIDERSWRDAYTSGLHCAEVHLAYAALVGLAAAHDQGIAVKASGAIFAKLSSRRPGSGPSMGDWVNVLKELSTSKDAASAAGDSLVGTIRRVLPQSGVVAEAQVRLSARRNDESHLRNVDPIRAEAEAHEVINDLQLLLEHASMLADATLIYLADNKWDSLRGTGRATVQILHGDHPLARSEYLNHDVRDLEEGSLYVIDGQGRWTLLRPFLTRNRCPECGSWSIYHPDRQVDRVLQLKALDHGHTTAGPDVYDALQSLGVFDTGG